MTSREEVERKVHEVLTTTFQLPDERVTPEAKLFEELDLDSLDAVDLAVKLESETGLKLTEAEFRTIRTVGDVVDTVHRKITEKEAV